MVAQKLPVMQQLIENTVRRYVVIDNLEKIRVTWSLVGALCVFIEHWALEEYSAYQGGVNTNSCGQWRCKSQHSPSTVQPRAISTQGLMWNSLSGVSTWQMGFAACYRGLQFKWSEAKPQGQPPALTCTSGSPHASGHAAAATPSRSAGLRLALRDTHRAVAPAPPSTPK